MSQTRLSKRLERAANAVREGKRVADVGCDHGKLCAYLVLSGKAQFATAIDISAPSLEKAKSLFKSLNIENKTKTLLCDGLSALSCDEADDVVIAGVGYDTIAGIIDACGWIKDASKRLVLVPASHHERVRKYLYANGFVIQGESAVYEDDQSYTVIVAAYSGDKKEISDGFAWLGLIKPDAQDGAEYIKRVLNVQKTMLNAPCRQEKKERARAIIEYIEKELI